MKSPLKSKTIWAGIITTATGILGAYNPIAAELISANSELILTALGAIMVILRAITTKPLN